MTLLSTYCTGLSAIELDIGVTEEAELVGGVPPMLKLASRLIYGEDILAGIPLLPIEVWTCDRMHSSYWLCITVFRRSVPVKYPLGYPDPASEFYGYDGRTVELTDGSTTNSTRNLIRVTGWMATALIALDAGQYIARKRDCHSLYRQWIGDEWTSLLENIYALCRAKWNYLIPTEPAEREQLRLLCARTLKFENHFLLRYKPFLLAELHAADEGRQAHARWVMEQIVYDDVEIQAALIGHAL